MDIDRFKGGIIFNWMNKNEIYNKYNLKELIIHPRVREDFYNNTPNLEVF